MIIEITYSHPAFPPTGIKVSETYKCEIIKDNCIIKHNKIVILKEGLNFVRTFFSPTNGLDWSEILRETKDKKKKNKKEKMADIEAIN